MLNFDSTHNLPVRNLVVSLSEIHQLIEAEVERLCPGSWILLRGDLGAGKTTFVKHLVSIFTDADDVTSPTFSILNVIDLTKSNNLKIRNFIHLDLYRLKTARELNFLGLENLLDDSSIVLLEWPDVVDDEEWESFFEMTRCPKPSRILEISICYVPGEDEKRVYELRYL